MTKDKLEKCRSEIVVAWRFRADGKMSVLAAAYLHAPRMSSGNQFSDMLNIRWALPS